MLFLHDLSKNKPKHLQHGYEGYFSNPGKITGVIYTRNNFWAELRLSTGYCIYTWTSRSRCEPHSAQLRNKAEYGLHPNVHHLLCGTQSCGLQVQQTEDTFWVMMMPNKFWFKSGQDCRCKCTSPCPAWAQQSVGPNCTVAHMASLPQDWWGWRWMMASRW